MSSKSCIEIWGESRKQLSRQKFQPPNNQSSQKHGKMGKIELSKKLIGKKKSPEPKEIPVFELKESTKCHAG